MKISESEIRKIIRSKLVSEKIAKTGGGPGSGGGGTPDRNTSRRRTGDELQAANMANCNPESLAKLPQVNNYAKLELLAADAQPKFKDFLCALISADYEPSINSVRRSPSHQWCLKYGTCGGTTPAKPCRSDHQYGYAVDMNVTTPGGTTLGTGSSPASWHPVRDIAEKSGVKWQGASDMIHFYIAGKVAEADKTACKAFYVDKLGADMASWGREAMQGVERDPAQNSDLLSALTATQTQITSMAESANNETDLRFKIRSLFKEESSPGNISLGTLDDDDDDDVSGDADDSYDSITDPSGPAVPGEWEREALEKVIAGGGSKKYDDVLPLDGGTVGIAHWAARGLKGLARAHSDFPSHDNIDDCQHVPGNDKISGNATAANPGCYYDPGTTDEHQWVSRVKTWLKANEEAQFLYWKKTKGVYGNKAVKNCDNWTTKRHAAIAAGIANSSPVEAEAAISSCTDPEVARANYAGKSPHRSRRMGDQASSRLNMAYNIAESTHNETDLRFKIRSLLKEKLAESAHDESDLRYKIRSLLKEEPGNIGLGTMDTGNGQDDSSASTSLKGGEVTESTEGTAVVIARPYEDGSFNNPALLYVYPGIRTGTQPKVVEIIKSSSVMLKPNTIIVIAALPSAPWTGFKAQGIAAYMGLSKNDVQPTSAKMVGWSAGAIGLSRATSDSFLSQIWYADPSPTQALTNASHGNGVKMYYNPNNWGANTWTYDEGDISTAAAFERLVAAPGIDAFLDSGDHTGIFTKSMGEALA